ncbi:DNA binding protein [Varidnaviria sp.]|uniref:DNA binding protein n=1 Tax=Lokiarchaeia virus SkuldV1 TaxID=3058189 RepID=A0AA46N1Y5_9VIRU|nr:DNA binding protein [Varidnaviria sp.]UPO70958.1 DNA binding protein [Lokiarchaeia virus SkuldV1]
MELTPLELQIVKELQVGILTNKQIAKKLNKDPGNISRKMKQLVKKQVVNKKRRSDGKITSNYYSLISDDIENLQQVVKGESSCKKEDSIPSEDIYDTENINLRETDLPEPNEHLSGVSEYHPHQIVQSEKTQMALDVDRTITHVLEYLSSISKSRFLTSKEQRLVRILSEESKNYIWIHDCIILFLSIAMKAERGDT